MKSYDIEANVARLVDRLQGEHVNVASAADIIGLLRKNVFGRTQKSLGFKLKGLTKYAEGARAGDDDFLTLAAYLIVEERKKSPEFRVTSRFLEGRLRIGRARASYLRSRLAEIGVVPFHVASRAEIAAVPVHEASRAEVAAVPVRRDARQTLFRVAAGILVAVASTAIPFSGFSHHEVPGRRIAETATPKSTDVRFQMIGYEGEDAIGSFAAAAGNALLRNVEAVSVAARDEAKRAQAVMATARSVRGILSQGLGRMAAAAVDATQRVQTEISATGASATQTAAVMAPVPASEPVADPVAANAVSDPFAQWSQAFSDSTRGLAAPAEYRQTMRQAADPFAGIHGGEDIDLSQPSMPVLPISVAVMYGSAGEAASYTPVSYGTAPGGGACDAGTDDQKLETVVHEGYEFRMKMSEARSLQDPALILTDFNKFVGAVRAGRYVMDVINYSAHIGEDASRQQEGIFNSYMSGEWQGYSPEPSAPINWRAIRNQYSKTCNFS